MEHPRPGPSRFFVPETRLLSAHGVWYPTPDTVWTFGPREWERIQVEVLRHARFRVRGLWLDVETCSNSLMPSSCYGDPSPYSFVFKGYHIGVGPQCFLPASGSLRVLGGSWDSVRKDTGTLNMLIRKWGSSLNCGSF